jgi:hypothetical protein
MTNKANNVSDVLIAARWIINSVGWCQHSPTKLDDDGNIIGMCALRAIGIVEISGNSLTSATVNMLKQANDITQPLHNWNDELERTEEEVLLAFDKAIAFSNLSII